MSFMADYTRSSLLSLDIAIDNAKIITNHKTHRPIRSTVDCAR